MPTEQKTQDIKKGVKVEQKISLSTKIEYILKQCDIRYKQILTNLADTVDTEQAIKLTEKLQNTLLQKKKYYIDKIKKKPYTIYSRKVCNMEEKNKTLLNIAGILNIAEGSLFCIFKPTIIFGLFIMAIGIYFIAMSKKTIEEQYEQRVLLLVVSIANLSDICLSSSNTQPV